jgi:hypothetical protein
MSIDMTSARVGVGPGSAVLPSYYQAGGAHFDGTNDSMHGTVLTTADASRIVVSCWLRNTGGDGAIRYMALATANRLVIQLNAVNKPFLQARNSSNTLIWQATGSTAYTADATWHHVFGFADCSGDAAGFISQDGGAGDAPTKQITGTINTGVTIWSVGARPDRTSRFTGDLAELWIGDPGREVTAADVKKFIAGGRPRFLGATGDGPFGVPPMFYFKGAFGSFQTNSGSAGDLAVTGALTAPARLYKAGA